MQLQQDQRFDLTALIQTVSDPWDAGIDKNTGASKQCFDVEVIDGSTSTETSKIMTMPLTIFMIKDTYVHQLFDQCMESSSRVTLLQMEGSKNKDNEYIFRSAFKGWHMVTASVAQLGCNKAQDLVTQAAALKTTKHRILCNAILRHTDTQRL